MVKIPLTKEEKIITEKSLAKHQKIMEVLQQAKKISEFQLNEVLPFDYEQNVENAKLKLKQLNSKIQDVTGLIKVTESQIKDGMEPLVEETEDEPVNPVKPVDPVEPVAKYPEEENKDGNN